MTHTSWRYRRRRTAAQEREFRDAQRRRVEARWARQSAERERDPVRQTRVVEITVRDSHRTRTLIRLEADENERSWGRWGVWQDGQRVEQRRAGKRQLAAMVAEFLA